MGPLGLRDYGLQAERRESWEAEDRLIPIMRIALCLSAQLLVFAHPEESLNSSSVLTSSVLGLYALYGVWVLIRTQRVDRISVFLSSWAHWIDVVWCLVLISISRGNESSFFIGLLFPTIVASLRWGFAPAVRIMVASILGFAAVSFTFAPAHAIDFPARHFAMRSLWLFGLGYLSAYWGELEIRTRRRLELISRLTGYANPRFGVDRTVAFILEHLKDFYGAKFSLMILSDPDKNEFRMLRTGDRQTESTARFQVMAPELASRLLELSSEHAAIHNARHEGWWCFGKRNMVMDTTFQWAKKVEPSTLARLAGILDAKSFVTVPVHYRSQGIGRLYVVADRFLFVPSDMRFLLQVLDHVNPIMENIRLVEQLALHAADEERRKIARDIHDSVIQPYLGLQIGLSAIREKTGEDLPEISRQISKLMEVTSKGIDDLRRYVMGLKEENTDGGLVPAMRRFADTFSEATDIQVDIETEGDVYANERLAAETFQMMTEGLNNIRKHTRSKHAKVRVICRLGHLVLEITNESRKGESVPFFAPVSISERAAALGGKVRTRTLPGVGSTVTVDIPL